MHQCFSFFILKVLIMLHLLGVVVYYTIYKQKKMLFLLGVVVCYTIYKQKKKHKNGEKKKQTKSYQFPRAEDIEKERSKKYRQLEVDMKKVHVVCSVEEWEEVLPLVSVNYRGAHCHKSGGHEF